MGNFIFLKSHWEDLSNTGELAENYVFSDPNTSMIKQGMFAERLVQYMLAYDGIEEPSYDNTHSNRIKLLKKNDLLPRDIDDTLYVIRKCEMMLLTQEMTIKNVRRIIYVLHLI